MFQSEGSDQLSAFVERQAPTFLPDLRHSRIGQLQDARNLNVADPPSFQPSKKLIRIQHVIGLA